MNFKANRIKNISISEIRKMYLLKKPDTLDLGLGQLGFDPPKALVRAGKAAFDEHLGYTPNAGIDSLRSAIAGAYNNDHGLHFKPEEVLVTNGVQEGLFVIMGSVLDPGDKILIPEIYFSAYTSIAAILGAEVVEYKLTEGFEIDIDDVVDKIDAKVKMLIINSPSNPTGAVQPKRVFQKLGQVAEEKNITILSDEIYSHLYYGNEMPPTILNYTDRALVLNGISKRSASAGLRLGWIIGKENFIEAILPLHQYAVTSASIVAQKAAIPILQGKAEEDESLFRTQLKIQRDWVIEQLSSWVVYIPQGAFYVLIDCSHLGKSKDVAIHLIKKINVLGIPGIAFGEKADHYLRLSFAGDFMILKKAIVLLKKELL